MTLESFKHIYRDMPLENKLYLLCQQVELQDNNGYRASECSINHNYEDRDYYLDEYHAMGDRIEWLLDEIKREIKGLKRIKAKSQKKGVNKGRSI